MGKLITSILAAVAEMELENIHEQTFMGRQQKAREGKWNGGFAPYGYRISEDILVIEPEEAPIVQKIYDMYTKDRLGVAGIVVEFDRLGIRKVPRKNSTLTRMNRKFVADVLSNPVYCGKIAYGRRHLEKPDKTGKRKTVRPEDYILVDGKHDAIISVEQYHEAQRIRKDRAPQGVRRPDNEHVHLLATLIRCPCCGGKLYGNTTRKKKDDGTVYKDYHFYACKHRLKVNGEKCSFKKNINERDIDEPVVAIISKLISDPHLADLLATKLDNAVDKAEVEEAISSHKRANENLERSISRISNQLDHLDYSIPGTERKADDLQNRLDSLYNEVAQHDQHLDELYARLDAINQDLLTRDAILQILHKFGELYQVITPAERQTLIRTLVEEITIYPEKQPDGRIIKSIRLAIPVVYENETEPRISWDNGTTVESIVCLVRE
jgi:site-specific DNA recombinase